MTNVIDKCTYILAIRERELSYMSVPLTGKYPVWVCGWFFSNNFDEKCNSESLKLIPESSKLNKVLISGLYCTISRLLCWIWTLWQYPGVPQYPSSPIKSKAHSIWLQFWLEGCQWIAFDERNLITDQNITIYCP